MICVYRGVFFYHSRESHIFGHPQTGGDETFSLLFAAEGVMRSSGDERMPYMC